MKKTITAICATVVLSSHAQYVSDAFKYAETKTNGSARFQALGGNHVSVGADISNLNGNPAGLGFYNRSEVGIGFGINNTSLKSTYISNPQTTINTSAKINSASLVLARPKSNRKTTWAFGYNQNSDLSGRMRFYGVNKASSLIDYYINKANKFDISFDEFDKNMNNFGVVGTNDLDIADASLFFHGYLINPTTDKGAPYFRFDKNASISQNGEITSSGSTGQWSVSFAENVNNKLYYGLTAGFYSVNYNMTSSFEEDNSPATAFNGFDFKELLNVTGTGFNVNAGVIYKATDQIQLGANIVTPTGYTVEESFVQNLTISPRSIPSETGGVVDPQFKFLETEPDLRIVDFKTPMKASAGVTYFLPKKNGFITATAETSNMGGLRANVTDAYFDADSYNEDTKNDIKATYKTTNTIRLGAEYKINKLALRGGLAHISDPYINKPENLDRSTTILSGGAGYKTGKSYIDFSISKYDIAKAYTPYTLPDAANYASVKSTGSNGRFTVTLGKYF